MELAASSEHLMCSGHFMPVFYDPHLQLRTGCLYALTHDEGVRENDMRKAGPLTVIFHIRIEEFWSPEGCMGPITERPLRAITALSAAGGTISWMHKAQIKASFASLSDSSMASPALSHAAGMSQSMTGRSRAAWRLDGHNCSSRVFHFILIHPALLNLLFLCCN